MSSVFGFFVLEMILLSGIALELRGEEKDEGIFLSNPDDTILYDIPPPVHPLFPIEGYFAVRFTPVSECTVKAGLVSVLVDTINPPDCSLFVWDDFGGMPGLPIVGTPIPFIPTGYPAFDRINLPISYIDDNDFWIGIFVPGIAGFGNYAFALSDSFDGPLRSYYSQTGFLSWCQFPTCGFGYVGDLLIRAIIEYSPSDFPDVGVISIDSPPDTIYSGFLYPVVVSVANFGDGPDSFPVVVNIPMGSYTDTTLVNFLAPGDTVQVSFLNWLSPESPCDTPYTVIATTLLGTDINPNNDTRIRDVFVQCRITEISEEPLPEFPTPFSLYQCSPNPFNNSTMIRYSIPVVGAWSRLGGMPVRLEIYDITGKLVETLVNERQEPGAYQVEWDGRIGVSPVSSGIYFYRLSARIGQAQIGQSQIGQAQIGQAGSASSGFTDTKRLILLR